MKKALITGITGQDGSYLSELLLEKGYEVHGIVRRVSSHEMKNLEHIKNKLNLYWGDIENEHHLCSLVHEIQPDEIYNLAAQSDVRLSFDIPEYTGQVTGLGFTRILEAVRKFSPQSKLYQASCHSEDTLVITPQGIKSYKEINIGDMVYSFNPETNKVEEKPVSKIFTSLYQGNLIHFKSRRIDILVTPNHTMYLLGDDGMYVSVKADRVERMLKYERTSQYSLPAPDRQSGITSETINIKDSISWANKPMNATKNMLEIINTNDFMYLMGLYIGDGYTQNNRKEKTHGNRTSVQSARNRNKLGQFTPIQGEKKDCIHYSHYIQYAIPESDKCRERLIDTLQRNNITFHTHPNTVEFSSWPLTQMFKQCGENVYCKHIPHWVLDWHPCHLSYLLQGIIDSDGHTRKVIQERSSVTTVSKELASNIVILCRILGKSSSISFLKGGIKKFKDNHFAHAQNSFIININCKNRNKIYKHNISQEPYKGKVWCLEVADNHNFLTMRNGKLAFTGNSSEMFGTIAPPQNENGPFNPQNPYAVAKLYAYHMAKIYRKAYKLFICNGILFNHESERRNVNFVTRKVTKGIIDILNKKTDFLGLGNLKAKRDWGYAKEYVNAMFLMLQQDEPGDFVVGTGEVHSVEEFVKEAFAYVNLDWEEFVRLDPNSLRPSETNYLQADTRKATMELGWKPKVYFKDLVKIMMDAELERQER